MEIVYLDPATREPDENGVAFERFVTGTGAVVLIPVSAPLPPPTLDDIKGAKLAELDMACNVAILAGFQSSALDEPHDYDYDEEAQRNLTGRMALIARGLVSESFVWKTKDAGPLLHTIDQFDRVCLDADNHVKTLVGQYWTLKAQVEAAENEVEVRAIQWEAGNGQGA